MKKFYVLSACAVLLVGQPCIVSLFGQQPEAGPVAGGGSSSGITQVAATSPVTVTGTGVSGDAYTFACATCATLTGSQALTNKTINGITPTTCTSCVLTISNGVTLTAATTGTAVVGGNNLTTVGRVGIVASSGVLTQGVASDLIALWSGTCNSTTFLAGNGACGSPSTAYASGTVISWSTDLSLSRYGAGQARLGSIATSNDGGNLRLNTLELSGAGASTSFSVGALGAGNGSSTTGTTFYSGNPVVIGPNGATAGSAKQYIFTSGSDPYSSTGDTGLARQASATIRVTDASTGIGTLWTKFPSSCSGLPTGTGAFVAGVFTACP